MRKILLLMIFLMGSGVVSASDKGTESLQSPNSTILNLSAFVPREKRVKSKTGRMRIVEPWTKQDYENFRIPDTRAYDPKVKSLCIWGEKSDLQKKPYDYEISELHDDIIVSARNININNDDDCAVLRNRLASSEFNDRFNELIHPKKIVQVADFGMKRNRAHTL